MRLRSLPACATALAAMSAVFCAVPALHADTVDNPAPPVHAPAPPIGSPGPSPGNAPMQADTSDPIVSPALDAEIRQKKTVRSIIQIKPGQSVEAVAGNIEQGSSGSRVLDTAKSPHFFVAELDGTTLAKLKQDRRVQSVYKDELSRPLLDSSTRVIRSDRANNAGWTGTGTTVAVLDTGIDRDHPFWAGRLVDEACFSSTYAAYRAVSLCPNNQPSQIGPGAANAEIAQCSVNGRNGCGHGSHVAGIAAGRRVTGAPANGVAPSAGILAIQVFSRVDDPAICGGTAPCFLSFTSDQKLALEYVARVAVTRNIAAVNMSLGGGGPYRTTCDANPSAAAVKPEFDALLALRVAPVVAAGNNGFTDGVSAPACISTAITVGATRDSDTPAGFTNRGGLLDLFAPGEYVNSAVPNNTYVVYSGTSMAAPHVAGTFALMRQAYPAFSVAQSLQRLRETGVGILYWAGTYMTTPRINAERATAGARTSV
ncbi:S8 family peptidase [Nonomuraea sp. NPDC049480]|uniref:S8 family peptidase n=1 Tax=Nonomuraea sp. NPDC049480 TaxID=3364353 RepID=UPI0037B76642